MTRFSRGFFAVSLLLLTGLALVQSASAQNPIVAKYVYGDDADAGLSFYQEQDVDRWCWAATASMIMAFHGRGYWLQCIQADVAYPGKSSPRTCCDDKESPLCNRTGWPQFERYGFHADTTDQLDWDQLVRQIEDQLPIAVAVKFSTGGGHMGAVVGYQIDENKAQYVLAIDPDGFHEAVLLRFEELFGESVDGLRQHWLTFLNIMPEEYVAGKVVK